MSYIAEFSIKTSKFSRNNECQYIMFIASFRNLRQAYLLNL